MLLFCAGCEKEFRVPLDQYGNPVPYVAQLPDEPPNKKFCGAAVIEATEIFESGSATRPQWWTHYWADADRNGWLSPNEIISYYHDFSDPPLSDYDGFGIQAGFSPYLAVCRFVLDNGGILNVPWKGDHLVVLMGYGHLNGDLTDLIFMNPAQQGQFGHEIGQPDVYTAVTPSQWQDVAPVIQGAYRGIVDWTKMPQPSATLPNDPLVLEDRTLVRRWTPDVNAPALERDRPLGHAPTPVPYPREDCPNCPPVDTLQYVLAQRAWQEIERLDADLATVFSRYIQESDWVYVGPYRTVLFPDSTPSPAMAKPTAQPGYYYVPFIRQDGQEIGAVALFQGPGYAYGGLSFHPPSIHQPTARLKAASDAARLRVQRLVDRWLQAFDGQPGSHVWTRAVRNVVSAEQLISEHPDWRAENFYETSPPMGWVLPIYYFVRVWDELGNFTMYTQWGDSVERGQDGLLHYRHQPPHRPGQTPATERSTLLVPNFPNPFNSATTIEFQLPEAGHVRLAVYNVLGQCVRTLVDEYRYSGTHTVRFDADDMPSGLYFARLTAGIRVETRTMVLMK